MLKNFNYITNNQVYNDAYFIKENDLKFAISSSYNKNLNFGLFENDNIYYEIYNSDNQFLSKNYVPITYTSQSIQRTYKNFENKNITYTYSISNSDLIILDGKYQKQNSSSAEILLSPITDVFNNSLSNGSYKILYNFFRNYVGNQNSSAKLKITQISNSEKELKIIPEIPKNSKEYKNLIDEFYAFGNNKINLKFIINEIKNKYDSANIIEIYFDELEKNKNIFNEIKFNYSLKSDSDFISFTNYLYSLIKNEFENFLFSNYNSFLSFSDVKQKYSEIGIYYISRELRRIRISLTTEFESKFNDYISVFLKIYNKCLDLNELENIYNLKTGSTYKFVLKFDNGEILPILNWKLSIENKDDDILHQPLLIKLKSVIPPSIDISVDRFIICNLISNSKYQKINIFTNTEIVTNKLKGPNFSIKFQNEGISTKFLNFEDLTKNSNQFFINKLNEQFSTPNITIDYSKFENFIKFSSAKIRISNFELKKNTIDYYYSKIDSINTKLSSSYDSYYISEKQSYYDKINNLISNFDNYERFLDKNPEYLENHKISSSYYDKYNMDSLVNNIPEYLLQEENVDFIHFLNMIGQHFDIIWTHIENYPKLKIVYNNDKDNITDSMVSYMLESFGWKLESDIDDLDISYNLEGACGNTSSYKSGIERRNIIWRRLLNNLPYLLKTKGTEESIRALFRCYGIPSHLYKIREYGGEKQTFSSQDESLYAYDDVNYLLYIKNNNEHISTNWNQDIKSVEFKFSIEDNIKTNSPIFLVTKDDDWSVGIIRKDVNKKNANLFLTIKGDSSYQTIMTPEIPIYNGNIYTVLVRKNNFDIKYSNDICINDDNIPIKYDLKILYSDRSDFVFYCSSSGYFSGSLNSNFKNPGTVRIGNYLTNDDSKFVGCIDYIRYWKFPIEDNRFESHASFTDSYDINNPYNIPESLLLKLDFETPIDLYTSSGIFPLNNLSYTYELTDVVYANNFENLSTSSSYIIPSTEFCNDYKTITNVTSSQFPYHFKKHECKQYVKLPNFGSSFLKSNKIRFEDIKLIESLSFSNRSTVKSRDRHSIDSNKLGIYFSPTDITNDEILKFFGKFELSDFIGDPADLRRNHYIKFEEFRKKYFEINGKSVVIQDYINYIRFIVDKSIFSHLKQLVPSRVELLTGILIEPTVLERYKIKINNPVVSQHTFSCETDVVNISSNIYEEYKPTIDVLDKSNISYKNNYFTFFSDQLDVYENGIYIANGYFNTYKFDYVNKEWVSFKKYVEIIKKDEEITFIEDNNEVNKHVKTFDIINLKDSGNSSFTGYYHKHLKFQRRFFNKTSLQTSSTTINEKDGIQKLELPFESFTTDRGRIVVAREDGGNILETN